MNYVADRTPSGVGGHRAVSGSRSAHLAIVAVLVLLLLMGFAAGRSANAYGAPSATTLVQRLKAELRAAAKAHHHHHILPKATYRRLVRTARSLRAKLPGASSACRKALTAAVAAGRDGARARRSATARAGLAKALKRARAHLGACKSAKPGPAPSPTPTPAPTSPHATAPHIGGTVIGSAGQPLGGLPLTVIVTTSSLGELYGHSDFATTTAANGTFTVPVDPAAIGALRYRAVARFPWGGGTWPRDLVTTAQGDPTHLAFRATLTHDVASGAGTGPAVRVSDSHGCTALGNDPAFPVSDPATTSVTITFTPAGPMIDGTPRTAFAGTVTDKLSLCGTGAQAELPAGAWLVTGRSDTGRALEFSTDGGDTYTQQVEVFGGPQTESSPLVGLDTVFADR